MRRLEVTKTMSPPSGGHDRSSCGSCSSSLAPNTDEALSAFSRMAQETDEAIPESSWRGGTTPKRAQTIVFFFKKKIILQEIVKHLRLPKIRFGAPESSKSQRKTSKRKRNKTNEKDSGGGRRGEFRVHFPRKGKFRLP